jgi:23S rRNA-intervening sequence protein
MTRITSYQDLEAWQLGMSFAEDVYAFPSQIAEGHRQGTRAYRHYVIRALGSQAECETQLELARRLELAPSERTAAVSALAVRLGQVLHGLARSLKRQNAPTRTTRNLNSEP